MSVRAISLSILLLSVPLCARAQERADGLVLTGSSRMRYEIIDGQARTGFDSHDSLLNVRSQIAAVYGAGRIRIGAELFDSRAYGADAGTPLTTNEVNTLEMVQAYVAADLSLGQGRQLTLTAGRMMLNLGSRRLVAADDYRNTTNGYTGLRADLRATGGVRGTFIYMLPQSRRPDDAASSRDNKVVVDREGFDQVLWGGLVSKDKALGRAMLELSFYHLGERDGPGRPTRNRSLNTIGARIIAEPLAGRLDFEVEALYQGGHVNRSLAADAARHAVSATFFHADIGYSFGGPWRPRLSIEVDRASGDKAGGRFGRFDPLFGMRRADLAPSGLYNAITRTNILTPGVRVEASPGKRLDGFITYRAMWLAADEDSFATTGVRDASGQSGDFAGHQMEGRIRWWLVPKRLRVEYSGVLLAKGRFLREAPNAPPARWTRYNSFNLTASF